MDHFYFIFAVWVFTVLVAVTGITLAALRIVIESYWNRKEAPMEPSVPSLPYRNPHRETRHYLSSRQLFNICTAISDKANESERYVTLHEIIVLKSMFWRMLDITGEKGISKSEWEMLFSEDERILLYQFLLGLCENETPMFTRDDVNACGQYRIKFSGIVGPEVFETGVRGWIKRRIRVLRKAHLLREDTL